MNRQSAPSGEIKPGLAVFWLAMILAVVAAAGCGAAQNQAAGPAVAVVKVTRDNLSTTLEIASEFQPYQEIDVFAKVSGYIRKLYVNYGTHVKQSQLTAHLKFSKS